MGKFGARGFLVALFRCILKDFEKNSGNFCPFLANMFEKRFFHVLLGPMIHGFLHQHLRIFKCFYIFWVENNVRRFEMKIRDSSAILKFQ